MKPSNYSVKLHSGVSKILGKTLLAFVQHEQKTVKKRLISDYLATISRKNASDYQGKPCDYCRKSSDYATIPQKITRKTMTKNGFTLYP